MTIKYPPSPYETERDFHSMLHFSKEVNVRELKKDSRVVLDAVEFENRGFIVTRHGRPVARMIPLQHDFLTEWQKRKSEANAEASGEADAEADA